MPAYELHAEPDLDAPVLLVALEGWIDAGGAAARAVDALTDEVETTLVATFDEDAFVDFRARRPTMHLEDGVNTGLTWNPIELHALHAPNGSGVLLLSGVEPDSAWHRFCDAVVDLALDLEVRMQLGWGAYPAGVPHTRPVQLSATASSEALATEIGFVRGTIDVPAGIEAALEASFAAAGLPAVGIWAQVPHYVSTMRYPAAAARLLEGLNELAGTDFGVEGLVDEVAAMRTRIDALVSSNPQHVEMIGQLEQAYDDAASAERDAGLGDLPSGDDLAEELQRFLREQGDS